MPGCWFWSGSYFPGGYGQVWSPALRRSTQAHRYVYGELVGPIPVGLQIDHLCRVRSCVNPAHLRIVTGRENLFAPGARTLAAANSVKTECPQGHAYDARNTYTYEGRRYCRVCKITSKRERRRLNSAHRALPICDAAYSSGAMEAVPAGSSSFATLLDSPPEANGRKSLRGK